jgi:hypothetical protein
MLQLVFRLWIAVQDFVGPDIDPNLVENVKLLAPRLTQAEAETHVRAATRSATDDFDTGLLLAMAYIESRFNPTSVSRLEGGKRVTGWWPSRSPAGEGRRFCGVLQTQAGTSWSRCLAARDIDLAYAIGAAELTDWLRLARGNIERALRGHGCGTRGLEAPCRQYEVRVFRVRTRLLGRTSPG